MTATVDRSVTETVLVREVSGSLLDPHQTGYLLTTSRDLPSQSITSDSYGPMFMVAAQQLVGSFVPAIQVQWLADFLESDMTAGHVHDEDLMLLPPPHWQRMRLRIRGVFDGVPSLIAFED